MINSNCIYFRMKSERDKTRLSIAGSGVTVRVLKQKIAELKNFKEDVTGKKKGPNPAYVLVLFNEQTKEEYREEEVLIQSGTAVMVKRTPVSLRPRIDAMSNKQVEEVVVVPAVLRVQDGVERYAQLAHMIIEGKTPDFLVCAHCEGVVEEPVLTSCCGHEGCESCIQRTPTCRQCQQHFELLPNKALRELLCKVKTETAKYLSEREVSAELSPYTSESAFFLMKSDNPERLLSSLRQSEWVLYGADLPDVLNAEYTQKANVLFLFISYKGGNFCGLGRMMSPAVKRTCTEPDSSERRPSAILNVRWLLRANLSALKTLYIRGTDGLVFKRGGATEAKPFDQAMAMKLIALLENEPKMEVPEFVQFTEAQLKPEEVEAEDKAKKHKEPEKPRRRSRTPDRHKSKR